MAKKKSVLPDYNKIELQVWEMSEPLVVSCGAELIDVEYVREAGNWYMRLYIDRDPAVDHDLCEQVSNLVSEALDKNDPIDQAYFLEISSPGLERPLRRKADFIRFAESEIVVRLYAPRDGKKEFCGILKGLQEDNILLRCGDIEMSFPLSEVAKAHLKADI